MGGNDEVYVGPFANDSRLVGRSGPEEVAALLRDARANTTQGLPDRERGAGRIGRPRGSLKKPLDGLEAPLKKVSCVLIVADREGRWGFRSLFLVGEGGSHIR